MAMGRGGCPLFGESPVGSWGKIGDLFGTLLSEKSKWIWGKAVFKRGPCGACFHTWLSYFCGNTI